jgi:predicted dehydrogenase
MKLVMVGTGAFAKKHLDGLARIKGAEVVSIVGRVAEQRPQRLWRRNTTSHM